MTLDAAIRAGDLAAATERVRAGADVGARGPDGLTPLMVAAALGRSEMVMLLLSAGADVLAVEPRMGATALHKAALSGDAAVIASLLDHGAFVDQQTPSTGHTPLMDAVLHKHEAAVATLLGRGARTTLRGHAGHSALDYARGDGLTTFVALIEARNAADAEAIAAQTLIVAVLRGDAAGVERAIAAGVPVDERRPRTGHDDDDFTPLGLAAREGRTAIVRLLLRAGADPRTVNGMMQGTPAHEAAYFGHADVITALTEPRDSKSGGCGPNLDAQGAYNGFTALHDAVWHGHLEAAQALIRAGATADLATQAGLTAHGLAIAYGYCDLAAVLAGAESERTSR